MKHFCAAEDIQEVAQFGGRYGNVIGDMVPAVTEKFNAFLNRNLEYAEDVLETFSLPRLLYGNKTSIWLEKKRITDASLRIDVSVVRDFTDPETTLLAADHYALDAEKGKITVYGYLPHAMDGVRITYTGGYPDRTDEGINDVMDCPFSLRMAAVEQTIYEANRLAQGFGATNEEETKSKVKLTAHGLLPQVQHVLQPYRRMLAGG